jgi:hypothetical protein
MSIASIGLTDRQRRALAGMGIEVWVRREAAPVVATVAITATRSAPPESETKRAQILHAPERSKPMPTPPVGAPNERRIMLDCVASAGVVLVGECASPLDRQLAKDIALALAPANPQPLKSQFRWPQTQTGDASEAAARNAFRGFLRGQIDRAHARWLLLFGTTATGLLDQDAQLGPETLRLPELRALRADPNEKRRLWLSVSPRIPA